MPSDEPLLIDDRTAAKLTGVSRSTWHVLRAAGKTPPAIKLGRACRWRRIEIEQWIEAGCPDADSWASMTASTRRLRVN